MLDHWYQLTADVEPGMMCADVLDALADDLNTPKALAAFHRAAQRGERRALRVARASLKASAPVDGRSLQPERGRLGGVAAGLGYGRRCPRSRRLIAARKAARAAKNFKESDRIRDESLPPWASKLEDKEKDGTTAWKVKR